MKVSEKLHSEDGQNHNVLLAFLCSAALYTCILGTGDAFLFVANQHGNCVDNTGKLYFVLATDIAIPCNYVKRLNGLY